MIEMYDYEDGNIPDKDVWEYIYNDIEYSYDERLRDLNVDTEDEIIAIASMGLWSGYAILDKNNLKGLEKLDLMLILKNYLIRFITMNL